MFGLSTMIALGPGLMLALSALAFSVVGIGFGRTRHAVLWAAGSVVGVAHWALLAAQHAIGAPPGHAGLGVDLLATLSMVLMAEGFRERVLQGRRQWVLLMVAGAAVIALAIAFVLPPTPLRDIIMPLLSCGLLVWAAAITMPRGARPAATETTVVALLLAVALVHAAVGLLAVLGMFGLPDAHVRYVAVYLTAAEPAAAAISLAALMLIAFDYAVELRRLLHTDPLTGVLNRQGFDHAARLAIEGGRARKLVLALADVDGFKQVNDRHGHVAGDAALARIGGHLAERLGRLGSVSRIGGEEFALLLPGVDVGAALPSIEAIRRSLADVRVEGHAALRLSASFGLAELAPDETLAALFERADAALYRSKREGRDRTTLADPVAPC